MVEFLKISLLALLFWRVLIIFYKPHYLRTASAKRKGLRLDFGGGNEFAISSVFLWQIVTSIGALVLVYSLYIWSFEITYSGHKPENIGKKLIGQGVIVKKGGYILRNHPSQLLTDSNIKNKKPIHEGAIVTILDVSNGEEWFWVSHTIDTVVFDTIRHYPPTKKDSSLYKKPFIVEGTGEVDYYENGLYYTKLTKSVFKKIYIDTGYVDGTAIIQVSKAVSLVKDFIDNLGDNKNKFKACEMLVRWEGRCEDDFSDSHFYGGIINTKPEGDPILDSKHPAKDGKAVLQAKYKALYRKESFDNLFQSWKCALNYDYSNGFIYTENFFIIKLSDGTLKIWDDVVVNQSCLGNKKQKNPYIDL